MFEIEILTFATGVEQEYEIGSDVASIALHAVGGTVTMMAESGGSGWTITSGSKETINGRDLSGKSLYFSGSTGTTLQIRKLTGLLC